MPVIYTKVTCPCCEHDMILDGVSLEGSFILECSNALCEYTTRISDREPYEYKELLDLWVEATSRHKPKFIQDMIDEELIPLIEENRKLSNKYNSLKFDHDDLLKERKNYIHKKDVMALIRKLEDELMGV